MTTIKGSHGELRFGYLVAAKLGKWSSDGRSVTAPVVSSNALYIARRPLSLTLSLGDTRIEWQGVDVQIADGKAFIALPDPPEV